MMSLSGLLDRRFYQPASCLIEIGEPYLPLSAELASLVTSVEITAGREEAATGMIIIEDRRASDGRWLAADAGLFTRWAPIRVSADFQTHVEEIFRGYITQAKPAYPNSGGDTTLEVQFQDESAALDREQMRTIWGELAPISDRDILTQLIAPLGLIVDPQSGQGQSSRALSQDATPIVFIRERAKANGYDLIFSEGQVYFGPKRLEGEAQAPILVYAGRATSCLNLEINEDGQRPDEVQFDHAPHEEGAQTTSETVTPNVATLGGRPVAEEGASLGTPSVWRVSREGDETEEELRARAQALVNDNSFRIRAVGEIDGALYGHVLKVARVVTIDGTGERYGGLYYVDKVVHNFLPEGYRQQFELIRNAVGETAGLNGALSAATSAIAGLF